LHKVPIHSLFVGSKVIKLPSCHSTNQVASDLLSDGKATQGTVVVTDNQTAGRGQRGNTWESEPGKNITLSAIVKPDFLPVNRQFDLTVVASLAVVHLLDGIDLPGVQIKWPNDIYCDEVKIAGILIENTLRAGTLEWAIIGIGVNINQQIFKVANASSARLKSGKKQNLKELQGQLIRNLNHYYTQLKDGMQQELRGNYMERLMWLNQTRWFQEKSTGERFQAKISNVGESGKLFLNRSGVEASYDFKQLDFIK